MAEATAIVPRDAALVATSASKEEVETFVAQLPAENVSVYLRRADQAVTLLNAMRKELERRLVADGQTGAHFTVDGVELSFIGSVRRGWRDLGPTLDSLHRAGVSVDALLAAASDARVTDLRNAVSRLTDPDDRATALEVIEAGRCAQGERGAPHLTEVERFIK